jgi:hypothetical protein
MANAISHAFGLNWASSPKSKGDLQVRLEPLRRFYSYCARFLSELPNFQELSYRFPAQLSAGIAQASMASESGRLRAALFKQASPGFARRTKPALLWSSFKTTYRCNDLNTPIL